ncbi:MAG TPA: helix-turn-helix transcriptional regulator [Beijerinckia sp.]|jgi:DNA-binding CsgD family transcriptional regulator|nr:helix-turn-helix transcriptional regulator [Beijerinckia sp.]
MRKFEAGQIAALVDNVYEAAIRPELWRGLLEQLSNALGADGCILIGGREAAIAPVCSSSLDEPIAIGLREGWLDRNPRLTRGLKLRASPNPPAIVTEWMMFTPWELDNLPYFAEYNNRFKARSFAGMHFAGSGPSAVKFTVERFIDKEPFSVSELETLGRLLPHLQRAGEMAWRLAAARADGMLEASAMFHCGAFLLDWKGRVIQLNDKAEALLGNGLTLRAGVLSAPQKDSDIALQKLIGSLIAPGPSHEAAAIGVTSIARTNAPPLLVHGVPLVRTAQDLFAQAKALLLIGNPSQQTTLHEIILHQAFGFTSAEAAISVALARGHDLDEIAQMRAVSIGTIRSQIKSIFAKTDTRRQAELVALLLRYTSISL